MAVCESCIHSHVCKYGENRSNGMYCTCEKCKQYKSTDDVVQIEEMGQDIAYSCIDLVESGCGDNNCYTCLAKALYKAGYRKQSEGEWVWYTSPVCLSGDLYSKCSVCGTSDPYQVTTFKRRANFCPNCGARMKGGE